MTILSREISHIAFIAFIAFIELLRYCVAFNPPNPTNAMNAMNSTNSINAFYFVKPKSGCPRTEYRLSLPLSNLKIIVVDPLSLRRRPVLISV